MCETFREIFRADWFSLLPGLCGFRPQHCVCMRGLPNLLCIFHTWDKCQGRNPLQLSFAIQKMFHRTFHSHLQLPRQLPRQKHYVEMFSTVHNLTINFALLLVSNVYWHLTFSFPASRHKRRGTPHFQSKAANIKVYFFALSRLDFVLLSFSVHRLRCVCVNKETGVLQESKWVLCHRWEKESNLFLSFAVWSI